MRMLPRVTMLQRAYSECGLRGLAPAARCYFGTMDEPLTGLLKLGNYPFTWSEWGNESGLEYDTINQQYSDYARHKFVGFTYGSIRQEDRKELIQRNPDIMIGSYMNLFAVQDWMRDAPNGSFAFKMWMRMLPYMIRKDGVSGEFCALMGTNYCYNFLDPSARAVHIDLIAEYVHAGKTPLDWLMLDFCSVPMPDLGGVNSDVVLERFNGGGSDQLIYAFADYLGRLKEAVPSTLLIPNGQWALRSDYCAAHVDGAFVEWAFRWFFGTDWSNEANALDPEYPHSLHFLTSDRYARTPGLVFLEEREPGRLAEIAPQFEGAVHLRRIP